MKKLHKNGHKYNPSVAKEDGHGMDITFRLLFCAAT